MRYQINSPMVITDDLDGEIIILNTESGKYFSTEKTGTMIWEMFSNGYTLNEVIDSLSIVFPSQQNEIDKDIKDILSQLIDEKLLKSREGEKSEIKVDFNTENQYISPEITAYSDMEKLLLMDPVHEVENMGWPNVKKGDSK